uniref:SWIM-type domain-containing protein n=1 Tax=Schistosoma mansoni TaxID=6183 RepID=A0A5K4FCB1_SCHMA
MRTVTNVGNYYTCNSPNCCHPSCWETIRKLMNGILPFKAKNDLWKRIEDSDIPYQLIYDSFEQSIFSDSQYSYKSPRLTNYAYFMMEKLKGSHIEDIKNKEGELIDEDNQDIKIDEECVKNSGEHLMTWNLLKSQLTKWNHIKDESQLKPPYVWISSKKLDKSENKPVKRKRSKPKGNGNLLLMLASKPEKCQSFVRQISLTKKDVNQTLVSDYKLKRNEQNDISEEASCMPRWMISCHISDQALRARLLPLARAQIRRHIRQGSLILCPNINNIESDRRLEKRITDSKVSLTKLSEDVCGFEGDEQSILFTRELTIPNQKLISLNESLHSNRVNVEQHQHTKPYFLNELLKSQCSGHDKRKVSDSPIQEQDELKAKSHLLSDLLLFQQSRLKRSEPTSHYYMSSIDNLQSLYTNRCYTSPISWPSLLPRNSESKEISCNLIETIPPSSNQEKHYTSDIIQSRNLLDNENSLSNINDSFEDCSNSVAIWQTMPGRLLRRSKTQYTLNKNQQLKNDQIFTDNSKQTKNELKLNFLIENVNNQHHKKEALHSKVINDTSEVGLLGPTEDTHERDNDGVRKNINRFNNSCWSSRRHPGYIERMHTIGFVSDRKKSLQDNNSRNNNDKSYIIPDKYKFADSVDLITLKPKTKSFLPQIRHSVSTEKHWHKNILRRNSCDLTDQNDHSSSLPMLIKPPPPSPDVKFLDF